MSNYEYWQKQTVKRLFDEIDIWPPEQKRMAGKLLIIGGNRNAFFTVANALEVAHKMGVGEARVLLPDVTKKQIPSTPEVYFAATEKGSGGFDKDALPEMLRHAEWADGVLLIGDVGKNANTSVALTDFMLQCNRQVFVTRDAVDAITPAAVNWTAQREDETNLMLAMPQLQKLLRTLYYPKVITLSMPMNQLVESLHKFTISYPKITIVTFHENQIVIAHDGSVLTQALVDTEWTQLTLWNGALAVRMATLRLWNATAETLPVFATALLKEKP